MTLRERQVRRYFDSAASSYFDRYSLSGPAAHALQIRLRRILEQLPGIRGDLLDAGCGPGPMARVFEDLGFTWTGVDLSFEMCRKAQEASRSKQAMASALDGLPFGPASFDVVVAAGSIEYATNDGLALHEIARVLRPGGRLLATFPNLYSPYRMWRNAVFLPAVARLRPYVYRFKGGPRPISLTSFHHSYSEGVLKALLSRVGLLAVDIVYLNFEILPSPLEELLPRVSVGLSGRLESMGRGGLRRLGTAMLVTAERAA